MTVLGSLGRLPGDIAVERGNFRCYFPLATAVLALAGCASQTPDMARTAAAWSGVAAASAVAERATGGCVALCISGMACNARTGLCEPSRCTGCGDGQVCVQDEYGARCTSLPLGVTATGTAPDPRRGGSIAIGVPDLPTPAPHHASDKP